MIFIERTFDRLENGMTTYVTERKAFADDDLAGINEYIKKRGEYKYTKV